MSVIKLTSDHTEQVKALFDHNKYMEVSINDSAFEVKETTFNALTYDIFCETYLSDLTNFHSFGYLEEGVIKALISFYESVEEPAWFLNTYRSIGNNHLLQDVLDAVIEYNEKNGRLKFFSLSHATHTKILHRFLWSKYNDERYGYFDEFIVHAKDKCFYVNPWELLYKRLLLPEDSIVRCTYLKQEYRTTLPIGGNL
jgi:hypothetical protein